MSDGTQRPIRLRIPYGYAKDSKAVYYENFAGKIKILKKADPATFVSNNDGYFAWDAKSIFWGGYLLPKACLLYTSGDDLEAEKAALPHGENG